MNPIVTKLREIEILLDTKKLAKEGADYMRSITPIRSGNARRNTYAKGDSIIADYPYAQRLDEGWSKQFEGELVEPTLKHLEDYIKAGNK